MGSKRMVLPRLRRLSVEVHAEQPQDAFPDDMVELRVPQHGPGHRYPGFGKGAQQ